MIILFHGISFLTYRLINRFKQKKSRCGKMSELKVTVPYRDTKNYLKFSPPVFRQRMMAVYKVLLDERWKSKISKLADFGCGELNLFRYLRQLQCWRMILLVDIDKDLLMRYSTLISPPLSFGCVVEPRYKPLEVRLLAGSVADPDIQLKDADVVTAIELIEHLYPDVLDAFPYNIFGYIEPKLVIITTPNSDFNILFPDLKGFRHFDHKFEWSREQFEDWANNIVVRHPIYTVSISGIGEGPHGTEHLGKCSQMAVFIRKDLLDDTYTVCDDIHCICNNNTILKNVCASCKPKSSYGVCTYYSCSIPHIQYKLGHYKGQCSSCQQYYELISKQIHPGRSDNVEEQKIMINEFKNRMNLIGQKHSIYFSKEKNRSEIPLAKLMHGTSYLCPIEETELRKILLKHGFKIEDYNGCCGPESYVIFEHPEIEENNSLFGNFEDRKGSESSDSYEEGSESSDSYEEDWDETDDCEEELVATYEEYEDWDKPDDREGFIVSDTYDDWDESDGREKASAILNNWEA